MKKLLLQPTLIALFICLLTLNLKAQTTVEKAENGAWTFIVEGKPLKVKGVTFGYDKEIENYARYFQDLQFLGVNTIRTWATGENTPQLLDAAHKHGIRVMVLVWGWMFQRWICSQNCRMTVLTRWLVASEPMKDLHLFDMSNISLLAT